MINLTTVETQHQSSPFDAIRQLDAQGNEFWTARDLQQVLNYKKWERFNDVVGIACENLESLLDNVSSHVSLYWEASGRTKRANYKLSRLACYHVALSCDSRGNDAVKMAKHYFAVKTHEAETVIPALSQENELLRLRLELEREKNLGKQLDNTMLQLHGDRVVLALRGCQDIIVEKETVVTEVIEVDTGKSTKFLSADQLKRAVFERTGQKLKSLKHFSDTLRKEGRDDLLIPVRRATVSEYIAPDKLDEAINIVYGKDRQRLLGE